MTLGTIVLTLRVISHLNLHLLACLASGSRTSPCASRQRHPKDLSPPLVSVFHQLLLFADWVVLRTLIVAWKSRHTCVFLLGLASCRALSRLPGQPTGHPVQRLGLVIDLAAL